jgi:hypothetical protein
MCICLIAGVPGRIKGPADEAGCQVVSTARRAVMQEATLGQADTSRRPHVTSGISYAAAITVQAYQL